MHSFSVNDKTLKMELIVPDVKIDDFKELLSGFAIPVDVKNDIIYCQKCLRTYIRVHQLVAARIGNNAKPISNIRKYLDEIEKEIFEINLEQKHLVIQLRCALEDFFITLRSDNVEIDYEIANGYISRVFSTSIEDPNYLCDPFNVKKRLPEKDLLEKYLNENSNKNTPEPLEIVKTISVGNRQVSLLKPKAERFAQKTGVTNELQTSPVKQEEVIKKDEDEKPPITLSSPAINNSRMRLLQALRKAQTMNALKSKQQQSSNTLAAKRSYEAKSPQSSTSDESSDTRETSPSLSDEPTEPSDYTQEMFLKIFGLYTLEHSKQLTQRRSKRKRRNVQNNEKSDFHYGNIDVIDNKREKKKEFLNPAPPVAKGRKRKTECDKDSKDRSDRSTSSSPTEEKVKSLCNECSKGGETPLCRCENCNGLFHTKCQRGAILKQTLKFREKCCPSCYRIKQKDTLPEEPLVEEKTLLVASAENTVNGMYEVRQLMVDRDALIKQYYNQVKKYKNYYVHNRRLVQQSDMIKARLNRLLSIIDSFK